MKGPCPNCPSSDGHHTYEDGSGYCFVCSEYTKSPNGNSDSATVTTPRLQSMKGVIKDLEFAPLSKRGISQVTCKQYHYGLHEGAQYASYFNDKKQIVAQKIRRADKQFACVGDMSQALLFGQHLFPSGGKRLVITEGEIDCLSVAQSMVGWPVVSIPSGAQSAAKAIKAQLTWIESFQEIILAFDADDAGHKAALEVCGFLKLGHVKIAQYPKGMKDANDCLRARMDVGKIILFSSQPYRPDGIIDGRELWGEMMDHWEGKVPDSFPFAYPKLNERTAGQRKGEVVMWTAGTGIGKSTIVNEVAYDLLVNKGCTVGIVALEESKKITGLRYISMHTKKRLHINPQQVTFDEYEEAFKVTAGSGRLFLYDHFGSTDSDNLMSKLRFLAVSCACDFIILDHISIAIIDQGEDERKSIDSLMKGLCSLTEGVGVGIHAVCHLRKPKGDRGFEDGERITLGHLRGSGGIAQMSHTVLAAERDTQDEDCGTTLRVLKCRFTGDTGPCDVIKYSKETGRFDLVTEGEQMFSVEDDGTEDY